MAKTATVRGLSVASWFLRLAIPLTVVSSVREDSTRVGLPSLQPAYDCGAHASHPSVPFRGIEDNVGPVEGRAQYGGFGHLTAVSTTDAAVVDGCDRVVLQRIVSMFD